MAVRPVHQERIFQKDKSPEELEQERKLIADKTNEAKVLLAAKTARYATPIGQNTLFCLPRELRDIIYKYALANKYDVFYPEGHIMVCDLPANEVVSTNSRCGLAPWLRTNKQICSEALNVYGSTRTVSAMYWTDPAAVDDTTDSFRNGVSSLLVFNANVICKITITKIISHPREDDKKFLAFLHHCGVRDLDVETIWFLEPARWSDLTYEDQADDWDTPEVGCWDGKVKRVKITYLTCGEKPEDSVQAMAIFAGTEALMWRLVGQGAKVILELVEFDKCQKGWTKTLVVERKV